MENEYAHPIKVPEAVYDGINRAWGTNKHVRYSIAGTIAACKQNKDAAAAQWVSEHEEEYGYCVWYGLYTEGMEVPIVTSVGARLSDIEGDIAKGAPRAIRAGLVPEYDPVAQEHAMRSAREYIEAANDTFGPVSGTVPAVSGSASTPPSKGAPEPLTAGIPRVEGASPAQERGRGKKGVLQPGDYGLDEG